MTTSGGALASIAAASFCGNWAFSTTTYSTSVLLAVPHSFIWSPSALSPSGVKDCQPQIASFVPLDLAAPVVPAPEGLSGCAAPTAADTDFARATYRARCEAVDP